MYKYGASKVRGGAPDVWILITTHHATAVFTLGRGDILESRTASAVQVLARLYPIFLSMFLPANLPCGVSIDLSTH